MSWVAPGAPGRLLHGEWQKSAINISPGLLTDLIEMVILQGEGCSRELERNDMDWLLGLLIPVKWALVLIAVYFLLKLIF